MLNSEVGLYGIFGVLTSVLNVVMFKALLWTGMDYRYSNLITLITVKLAAYLV